MSWPTEMFTGMRDMFRLYEKMLESVCSEHGMTVAETEVMSFLRNNPEKDTAADISELRRISKASVSKSVESLIQKGMLKRIPDKCDRRKIHLVIEDSASSAVEDIDRVREEFISCILSGFTEDEIRFNEDFSRRLYENVRKEKERREKRDGRKNRD